MSDIIIKKSKINKNGVFAARDFKKGEIVLKWNPKIIEKTEINQLSNEEKHYLQRADNNKQLLMQSPEKFVNHSCSPNTYVKNNCDIALKNIQMEEEITSDYTKTGTSVAFDCNCGDTNCKKIINPSS